MGRRLGVSLGFLFNFVSIIMQWRLDFKLLLVNDAVLCFVVMIYIKHKFSKMTDYESIQLFKEINQGLHTHEQIDM